MAQATGHGVSSEAATPLPTRAQVTECGAQGNLKLPRPRLQVHALLPSEPAICVLEIGGAQRKETGIGRPLKVFWVQGATAVLWQGPRRPPP